LGSRTVWVLPDLNTFAVAMYQPMKQFTPLAREVKREVKWKGDLNESLCAKRGIPHEVPCFL
jgi:hypothetical protein